MTMRRVIEIAVTIVGVVFMGSALWSFIEAVVNAAFNMPFDTDNDPSYAVQESLLVKTRMLTMLMTLLQFWVGYWICKGASGIARHFRPDE
ncbi:MAG: hypothetical protein OXT69_12510 [Candidatus Poribacteria bacterium]|nr:hypothetical protein [Candidatus Poribacteria bacterium]